MRHLFLVLVTTVLLVRCSSEPEQQRSTDEKKMDFVFRPKSPYVSKFIDNPSMPLRRVVHHQFQVYFKENSYTARNLDLIKQELDEAFSRIKTVLNIESYPYGIRLIAVDSEEDMEDLMGYHIKGGSVPGHDFVFFVFNDQIRPQFKHEIFHSMSYETWGDTSRLLNEGGATYTDNFCHYANPMYTINSYYYSRNRLFTLDELIHQFDQKTKENDLLAYVQSAGIFKYLYENYGTTKMKTLWKRGFTDFASIYGFEIDQLEKDWLETIKSVPIPENFDEEMLMSKGCG